MEEGQDCLFHVDVAITDRFHILFVVSNKDTRHRCFSLGFDATLGEYLLFRSASRLLKGSSINRYRGLVVREPVPEGTRRR